MNVFRDQVHKPVVSIIVPVRNEESSLLEFYENASKILKSTPYSYELIFVDDGSTDSTAELLNHLRCKDDSIGSITLSRGFGKEYAVSAGMHYARGEAVIVMDVDLQDPPALIPEMISYWKDGYDVVAMRRSDRTSDSLFKRTFASLFYMLMTKFSDVSVPSDVGDFRLMSRKVVGAINELPENNRCLKGVFAWVGFNTMYMDFKRQARTEGKSQWSFLKLTRLALDGITSFSIAPLRLASLSGGILAMLSFMYGLFILSKTLLIGEPVAGFTTLAVLITFLGSMQLLAIGILGEYVGRTFIEVKKRPLYLIDKLDLPTNPGLSPTSTIAVPLGARPELVVQKW